MGVDGAGEEAVPTIVMREVGEYLVASGDAVLPSGQHAGFIAHMAALHSDCRPAGRLLFRSYNR